MGATINGETVAFDTDYLGVWYEEQNSETRRSLQHIIDRGDVAHVVFQPGDGTRYEFLLFITTDSYTVSNGTEPERDYLVNGSILYATILNGLGDGVGSFNRDYVRVGEEMNNARYRINDKMKVPNVCTVEALAATVAALWYMED